MFSSIAAAPASCIGAGVIGPPLGGDTVELRDHRYIDGRRGALQQNQVTAGAAVLLGHGGK